jgi:hypothetical protein
VPFVQTVYRFDKRWLEYDGTPTEIPTRDKKYIFVDTYARWRIADPLRFYQAVHDEHGAQSRLDDIVDGETRNAVASFDLIEGEGEVTIHADNATFGDPVLDLADHCLYDWMMAQAKVSRRLADTFEAEMNGLKVDIHQGYGELLDRRTLKVTGGKRTNVTFTADNVIVATGSRPEFHGSSEPKLVNSEELLRTPRVPDKLMIVGAGYIGCEFASIYRTLGCAVTIIRQKAGAPEGPRCTRRLTRAMSSLMPNGFVT